MAEEENKKKEITLEQAKKYRLILRIVFFLVAFAVPMIIIGVKFQLFTHATTTKWSITGITLLLIVGWRFKDRLRDWIDTWENSNIFKHILVGIGRVWPFILIVSIVAAIQFSTNKVIADVLFCLEWACICELLCYIIIYPIEMKMDYIVKRQTRKQERIEDYKDAQATPEEPVEEPEGEGE